LPKNPIIIDCGAHVGSDSIEMARIWPHATIYAFEALPGVLNTLTYNTRNYKNIKCFNLALGNINGVVDFYQSGRDCSDSSSLLKPNEALKINHKNLKFEDIIKVTSVTLNKWRIDNKMKLIYYG